MPIPALLLVLATLLPLASFGLLLLIGKRMGDPLAGWVATAFAAGSFALSMGAMISWYNAGQLAGMTWGPGDKPIELIFKWLPIGPPITTDRPALSELNLHIDTLTIAMFNTITLVVVLGHAFSVRCMPQHGPAIRPVLCFAAIALFLDARIRPGREPPVDLRLLVSDRAGGISAGDPAGRAADATLRRRVVHRQAHRRRGFPARHRNSVALPGQRHAVAIGPLALARGKSRHASAARFADFRRKSDDRRPGPVLRRRVQIGLVSAAFLAAGREPRPGARRRDRPIRHPHRSRPLPDRPDLSDPHSHGQDSASPSSAF